MISKATCPGPAGKTRGTRLPVILVFVMLFSLDFGGGEATAVTWQAQGPSPFFGGEVVIAPNNPVTGAIQSLLLDPTHNNIMYVGAVNGGIWKTTPVGRGRGLDRGQRQQPRLFGALYERTKADGFHPLQGGSQ